MNLTFKKKSYSEYHLIDSQKRLFGEAIMNSENKWLFLPNKELVNIEISIFDELNEIKNTTLQNIK